MVVSVTDLRSVVFDFGGVLVDWNPRHLYRKVFGEDVDVMERFLAEVCTVEWHLQHDRGRSFAETIPELSAVHPEHADRIAMWGPRFVEMIAGEIPGAVAVLTELRDAGVPLYGLSNMPAEAMDGLRAAHPFIDLLDGVVVSGEEGMIKPEPAIFELLTARFGLEPAVTLFVDDMPANVDAARALGFEAHRFIDAAVLRAVLVDYALLE